MDPEQRLNSTPVLSTSELRVVFPGAPPVLAVRGVDLEVRAGEMVGLVGESGSGKSALARAILGLHGNRAIVSGSVVLRGEEITGLSSEKRRLILGRHMSFIPQDPSSSLNPIRRVGSQVREAVTSHEKITRRAAEARALELLQHVGLPEPRRCLASYPHQLSGGMKQRVVIAMAVACHPELIVADEPTTALDVTVQARILELLSRLRDELGASILLITHNLAVVGGFANRVEVMYAGRIVESLQAKSLATASRLHPYTEGLLRCIPGARWSHPRIV